MFTSGLDQTIPLLVNGYQGEYPVVLVLTGPALKLGDSLHNSVKGVEIRKKILWVAADRPVEVNIDFEWLFAKQVIHRTITKVSAARWYASRCVNEIIHVVFANTTSSVNLGRAHPRENFTARYLAVAHSINDKVCWIGPCAGV